MAFRLSDLGERRIIEEVLRPRYGRQGVPRFGDDCALVAPGDAVADGILVATTDPCPEPVANHLGYSDLYYRGWLLATINLSDLGAVGARPLGLLTSLILPNELTVSEFSRLLDGIDACCAASGTRVIGGNIKEGRSIDLTATAIGVCPGGACMSRTGANVGDLIAVVGDLGLFWAGVLAAQRQAFPPGIDREVLLRNVLTPMPKVSVGLTLAQNRLLTACLDNSDGLYASLTQLAEANHVEMHVNMDDAQFSPEVLQVASLLGVDPVRLAMGWGDWQLVGCVSPSRVDEVNRVAQLQGTSLFIIGNVRAGRGIVLSHGGHQEKMAAIDSQRFTRESWFTSGLANYIESLVKGPLWG